MNGRIAWRKRRVGNGTDELGRLELPPSSLILLGLSAGHLSAHHIAHLKREEWHGPPCQILDLAMRWNFFLAVVDIVNIVCLLHDVQSGGLAREDCGAFVPAFDVGLT